MSDAPVRPEQPDAEETMMRLVGAIVTPLAAALLCLFAYAFAPFHGNLLGDAAIAGVPLWIGTLALAAGTAAVAVDAVRRQIGRR